MNALEIRNLTKEYDGFKLDNINLTLPQGCIMGLIGENGAGKTTIIKLILDMIKRNSGSVTIFGKDNKKEILDIKQDIGVVLTEVGLPSCLTVDQIGKVLSGTYKRWDDNLYKECLDKLNFPPDKPFKDFSTGMKKMLGIACALSHHPKLLILDEATSGLDPVIRDEITDVFAEFTRDETHSILISSHIVSDLEKLCDYIAFLHKGKLLLCEEKDALLEKYCIVQCTPGELEKLDKTAVKGKKISSYGAEALVLKSSLPYGMQTRTINIEDLFIFMVKEMK